MSIDGLVNKFDKNVVWERQLHRFIKKSFGFRLYHNSHLYGNCNQVLLQILCVYSSREPCAGGIRKCLWRTGMRPHIWQTGRGQPMRGWNGSKGSFLKDLHQQQHLLREPTGFKEMDTKQQQNWTPRSQLHRPDKHRPWKRCQMWLSTYSAVIIVTLS